MGELRYRQRVGVSLDNKTVELLNELTGQTGVPKSKLIDFAIFLLAEKYKSDRTIKPPGYIESNSKNID